MTGRRPRPLLARSSGRVADTELLRWIHLIGTGATGTVVAKTLRRRLLTLPGRFTRGARQQHLHLPTRWPWATDFNITLARLRAIPLRC